MVYCFLIRFFSTGYLSDDGSPYRRPKASADMSIFREAVKEYLSQNPVVDLCTADKNPKSNKIKESSDIVMEKFSGLRIRSVNRGFHCWRGLLTVLWFIYFIIFSHLIHYDSSFFTRNPLLSVKDINNHFADVRFVRLPAIRYNDARVYPWDLIRTRVFLWINVDMLKCLINYLWVYLDFENISSVFYTQISTCSN